MKGNVILGTARGKMGDIVAKVVHGKQIYAKYQPNIFNPNSQKQETQRIIFAECVAFVKDFLSDNALNSFFAVQIGSARNIFLNINRFAIYCSRTLKGAQGYFSKIKAPLMVSEINENEFLNEYVVGENGLIPVIGGVQLANTKIYFGSISKLKGNSIVVKALFTDPLTETGCKGYTDKRTITQHQVTAPENARKKGFQLTPDDCGNWPFIYEVTMPATFEISSAMPQELTVENEGIIFVHLMFTTKWKETIGYQLVDNPPSLP